MHREKQQPKKDSKVVKFSLLVLGCGLLLFLGYWVIDIRNNSKVTLDNNQSQQAQKFEQQKEEVKTRLKSFSGEEFKKLYNEFGYPNTRYISENSVITGDPDVDLYIQQYAEKRGYKRRSAPVVDVFKVVQEADGLKLQERAYQPWEDLRTAAEKEGINIYLTAAYRSQAEQKDIFLQRFNVRPSEYKNLLNGTYDAKLDEVLSMTAIPGYSRHHNGYTIDIACQNQQDRAFEFTVCFDWLSENNYENAKKFGWIPSYPEEAQMQGPEPESWEYVWVGDAVFE